MVQVICIEGNIGTGKSTFVEKLREVLKDREDVCFLDEPIDMWMSIKNESGNIIEHYYNDKQKYGFAFQVMAYVSRLSLLKTAMENPRYRYIITERSLFTDKHVFCQMLYDDGIIDDISFQIYNMWSQAFDLISGHKCSFVYLRASPSVSHSRVLKRSRKGENEITMDYMIKCHEYHERWLLDSAEHVFDADVDESETETWLNVLRSIIQ